MPESRAARYRRYAEDALYFAGQSLSESDRRALEELAWGWAKEAAIDEPGAVQSPAAQTVISLLQKSAVKV